LNQASLEPVPKTAPQTPPPRALRVIAFFLGLAAFLLVIFAAAVGLIYLMNGPETIGALLLLLLLNIALLIHVFGHLLAAWLCGVQVRRVAIGLGPAVPGCQFQIGETTFRIGLIPLGGYARIVHTGADVQKSNDYPRALANKPWWKRLLIYSSGALINALVACLCFLFSFNGRQTYRTPGVVGSVEPGTPPWEEGVHSGWVLTRIGERERPSFEELHALSVVTREGREIEGEFQSRSGREKVVKTTFVPLRDDNRNSPGLGIYPGPQLELIRVPANADPKWAVHPHFPAAVARELDLLPGCIVVGTSDPEQPDGFLPLEHDLSGRTWDHAELSRRLWGRRDQPLRVRYVQPSSRATRWTVRERTLPTENFLPGDRIVACSRVPLSGKPYDPFDIETLPPLPGTSFPSPADPLAFRRRLLRLLNLPIVIQVVNPEREASRSLYVPPAYHRRLLGARMKMGEIAALRKRIAQTREDIHVHTATQPGDVIVGATMQTDGGEVLYSCDKDTLDPETLPDELLAAAMRTHLSVKTVTLTMAAREGEEVRRCTLEWDDHRIDDVESPGSRASPLSIPALGIAYWVESEVVELDENSAVAQAGLQQGDVICAMRYREVSQRNPQETVWSIWENLLAFRDGGRHPGCWSYGHRQLQNTRHDRVQVLIRRNGMDINEPLELPLSPDPAWPRVERGMIFRFAYETHVVDAWYEAVGIGYRDTLLWDYQTVRHPRAIVSLSAQLSLVVLTTPLSDRDFAALLFFLLGVMNVNVVLLNLLPLPFCDGGRLLRHLWKRSQSCAKSPCDTLPAPTTISIERGGRVVSGE